MGHESIEGVSSIPTSSTSPHGVGGGGEDGRIRSAPQPPLQVIYTCRSETWITVIPNYVLYKLVFLYSTYARTDPSCCSHILTAQRLGIFSYLIKDVDFQVSDILTFCANKSSTSIMSSASVMGLPPAMSSQPSSVVTSSSLSGGGSTGLGPTFGFHGSCSSIDHTSQIKFILSTEESGWRHLYHVTAHLGQYAEDISPERFAERKYNASEQSGFLGA